MATNTVQIKRSQTTAVPPSLKYGELAYSFENNTKTLYIGDINENPVVIGGAKYLESNAIAYDNAVSQLKVGGDPLTDVTTVQAAIDEVDRQLDEIHATTGAGVVGFDNTASALTATTVQGAVDEIDGRLDSIEGTSGSTFVGYDATATGLTQADGTTPAASVDEAIAALDQRIDDSGLDTLNESTGASTVGYDATASGLTTDGTTPVTTVQQGIDANDAALDAYKAEIAKTTNGDSGAAEVGYDNTTSGLAATDVQGALDEIDANADQLVVDLADTTAGTSGASDIGYDDSVSLIGATDVQSAIAALDSRLDTATDTGAAGVSYDATGSGLESSPGVPVTNMQQAVDALDAEQDALGETGATAADSGASQIAYNNAQAQYPDTTEGVVVDDVQSALDSADDRLDAIELNYVTTNTDQTISGNKTFTGDTVFQGTSTVVNSTDMSIQDNIIELNRGETSADGSGVSAGTAGITIDRGTTDGTTENPDARLLFDEVQDRWVIDNGDGNLQTIAVGDEANYTGLDGINIGDGTTIYDAEGAPLANNAIEVDNTVLRTDRNQDVSATHTFKQVQNFQAGADGLAADGSTKTQLTNFVFETSVVDGGGF